MLPPFWKTDFPEHKVLATQKKVKNEERIPRWLGHKNTDGNVTEEALHSDYFIFCRFPNPSYAAYLYASESVGKLNTDWMK